MCESSCEIGTLVHAIVTILVNPLANTWVQTQVNPLLRIMVDTAAIALRTLKGAFPSSAQTSLSATACAWCKCSMHMVHMRHVHGVQAPCSCCTWTMCIVHWHYVHGAMHRQHEHGAYTLCTECICSMYMVQRRHAHDPSAGAKAQCISLTNELLSSVLPHSR